MELEPQHIFEEQGLDLEQDGNDTFKFVSVSGVICLLRHGNEIKLTMTFDLNEARES